MRIWIKKYMKIDWFMWTDEDRSECVDRYIDR